MSNFVYGKIFVDDDSVSLIDSKIDFSMMKFSTQNNFALHFITPLANDKKDIFFCISDNYFVNYCEYFLEPIIYTLDGIPLTDALCKDLDKLHGLIERIFEFEFVEKVELRFSYVEVEEDDYEICKTSLSEMKNVVLKKYLSETDFPVINVVIER